MPAYYPTPIRLLEGKDNEVQNTDDKYPLQCSSKYGDVEGDIKEATCDENDDKPTHRKSHANCSPLPSSTSRVESSSEGKFTYWLSMQP